MFSKWWNSIREDFWSWVQNSSLCFLPGLQILADFLHMLTNHLWKLALTIITGNAHKVLAYRRVCKRGTECCGCLWARWGPSMVGNPQWLVVWLLAVVHHTVSRIWVFLMPFEILLSTLPASFCIQSFTSWLGNLYWVREKGDIWAQLGKPGAHSQALAHLERSLLALSSAAFREGWCRQVKSNSSL